MSRVTPETVTGHARGFTLLEVLLVLVLLAFGAALVVPALVRPSGTELRAATGTVAAGLRRAREEAVSRQHPATMTVDVERREFRIEGERRTHHLPERVDLSLFTARSELEGDTRGRIRFFPDGSSTGGRVTLASGERRYFVDVDWLTGQVRVRGADAPEPSRDRRGRVVLAR